MATQLLVPICTSCINNHWANKSVTSARAFEHSDPLAAILRLLTAAYVNSGNAQTNRPTNNVENVKCKVILGPADCVLHVWLAGKNPW